MVLVDIHSDVNQVGTTELFLCSLAHKVQLTLIDLRKWKFRFRLDSSSVEIEIGSRAGKLKHVVVSRILKPVMPEAKLTQLKQAEALVLADPSHYSTILPAVLALAAQPDIPLRHWISNFLVNTFSSRVLDPQVKGDLASGVVDTLRILVDDTDAGVLKSCVQCSSLIYPLLFRRMYSHCEVTECVDVGRQRGSYGDGLDS
jgi:hypothetical protein